MGTRTFVDYTTSKELNDLNELVAELCDSDELKEFAVFVSRRSLVTITEDYFNQGLAIPEGYRLEILCI